MYGFNFTDQELSKLKYNIKELCGVDYSNYSKSAFRISLNSFMQQHAVFSIDELLFKLTKEPLFSEFLIRDIANEDTEAFRDTLVWKIIRFDILKDLYEKREEKIRIWVPGCTSGDELYSLNILIKENYFTDKVEIFASSISQKLIDQIKTGTFSIKKCEINQANYLRYKGKCDFKNYYTINGNKAQWDTSLIEKVKFLTPGAMFKSPPENIQFIFYRNRMLYFNYNLQLQILNTFHKCLSNEGFLILGAKETLGNFSMKEKFSVINENESVYKKIS